MKMRMTRTMQCCCLSLSGSSLPDPMVAFLWRITLCLFLILPGTITTTEAAFIFRNELTFSTRSIRPTATTTGSRNGRLPNSSSRSSAGSLSAADLSEGGEAIFTQVISDVDDTLKSSGGVNVAGVALGGIDVQYARGDFYPGVFEFMLQVSMMGASSSSSSSSSSSLPNTSPPKVAILTARAEEFKLALELKDDSKLAVAFRETGEAAGLEGSWGLGPVLYGSVAEWIAQDRKGLRKFTNFERLLQQDPTGAILQYVYVGDTGELDQEAGETMLREYPELVKAVFLHVVSSEQYPAGFSEQDIPPPQLINGRPIIFFRTYVGAAVEAVQLGFMTLQGLEAVVKSASEALADVPQTHDKWIDVQRDIDRANALLAM